VQATGAGKKKASKKAPAFDTSPAALGEFGLKVGAGSCVQSLDAETVAGTTVLQRHP
jgi:hypothetical protein